MPSPEKDQDRHSYENRFGLRLPKEVVEVWRGPLKGKAGRFLVEGARKYLEENGHSAIALQEKILEKRTQVLREEVELQILEMQLAGIQGVHGTPTTPPSPAPTPPTNGHANGKNGNGNGAVAKAEKEFRAFHRSQERAHVPREERQKNHVTKAQDMLARDKDLQARFHTAEELLAYLAKQIL